MGHGAGSRRQWGRVLRYRARICRGSGSAPDQITGFGLSDLPTTALICGGGNDALLDLFFDNVFGFDAMAGNVQVRAP